MFMSVFLISGIVVNPVPQAIWLTTIAVWDTCVITGQSFSSNFGYLGADGSYNPYMGGYYYLYTTYIRPYPMPTSQGEWATYYYSLTDAGLIEFWIEDSGNYYPVRQEVYLTIGYDAYW